MKHQLLVYGLLCLLLQWPLPSLQAEVDESCKEGVSDTQCFTIKFSRSAFEGADETITIDSTKSKLCVGIFSNSPTTSSLKAVTVTLSVDCPSEADINVTQLAVNNIQSCRADLVTCNRANAVFELKANGNSVKDGVFYAQIKMPQPYIQSVQVHVEQQLDGDEQTVYSSSASTEFTAVSINSVTEEVDCNLNGAEALGLQALSTNIASIGVLGTCLILVAIASRVYAMRDLCRKKPEPDGANAMLELEAGPSSSETAGSYVKQPL